MAVDREDLDLLRRRVLNVIGHELRTPVTTLAGLADQLAITTDEATRAELVSAISRNAHRLDRLVEDLLLAAAVETVIPVGPREPVDLVAAARAAWEGAVLPTFVGQAVAKVRPAAAHQAIAVLLDNASVHGAPPVTVTARVEGIDAIVEVESAGPSLPAADIELAAEAFYRGERAVTTAAGLGLGLAIARTLARSEGGDVTVRAGATGGVVARLELPAA
jgi:two-component system sensor histidine kinase KdpD